MKLPVLLKFAFLLPVFAWVTPALADGNQVDHGESARIPARSQT